MCNWTIPAIILKKVGCFILKRSRINAGDFFHDQLGYFFFSQSFLPDTSLTTPPHTNINIGSLFQICLGHLDHRTCIIIDRDKKLGCLRKSHWKENWMLVLQPRWMSMKCCNLLPNFNPETSCSHYSPPRTLGKSFFFVFAFLHPKFNVGSRLFMIGLAVSQLSQKLTKPN